MRIARSARANTALGATLIALTLPAFGGQEVGAVNGIDAGGLAGIDAGGVNGIDAGGISGIDAGGISGIDAGGALGIDAGGISGIDAGGALGIDAGGISGIDAGGALGIDAGGISGIDAGGALGIDAGGISGIDAGGALGIDAGGISGIDAGGALGIDAGGISGIDAGDVLAGPVEAIDLANGTFVSLGQVVMTSGRELRNLRVGDFVAVEGSVMGPGWLYADAVTVTDIDYVPGATEVFVSGMLSEIDSAAGTARIGKLTIDYTPSLARAQAPSSAMWTFRGTQPAVTGLMISEISGTFEQ
jgi:hypothetical protein